MSLLEAARNGVQGNGKQPQGRDEKDKDFHLSYSRVSLFSSCGLQYYFKYICGLVEPISAALVFGGAVANALENGYKEIIGGSNENNVTKAIRNSFLSSFDLRKKDVNWHAEKDTPDELRNKGKGLLDKYYTEYMVDQTPISCEERVELFDKELGVPIIGYIDLVIEGESGPQLVDHKTSGKKFSDNKVKYSQQLMLYARAKGIKRVGFHVLKKTKDPDIQIKEYTHTRNSLNELWGAFKTTARALLKAIDAHKNGDDSLFTPSTHIQRDFPPMEWVCERCGYKKECKEKLIEIGGK
jgi:hypothetical protein